MFWNPNQRSRTVARCRIFEAPMLHCTLTQPTHYSTLMNAIQ